MNIEVIRIDTEDHDSRTQFEFLFNEYSSASSTSSAKHIVKQLFELPYFHGFICYIDNESAAFAVCFESFSTYRAKKILNIHDFMVSLNYRGKGLGKALLFGIEQYCNDNDYLKITLEVNQINVVAQNLYASCGYEDYQATQNGLFHWQKYLL